MRCVSVVERVELDASVGSVMPAAICVDDVDNDGANELILGTVDGSVYIYKGIANNKPWCQWSCATANEGKARQLPLSQFHQLCYGKRFIARVPA